MAGGKTPSSSSRGEIGRLVGLIRLLASWAKEAPIVNARPAPRHRILEALELEAWDSTKTRALAVQ
eukprot:1141223-Prymnesium_polylepis.2